jgi:hypothetical protein
MLMLGIMCRMLAGKALEFSVLGNRYGVLVISEVANVGLRSSGWDVCILGKSEGAREDCAICKDRICIVPAGIG